MLYLFGKTISESKQNLYSLNKLYGIDIYVLKKIFKYLGINPYSNLKELNQVQINILIKYIDKNFIIEQNLKKKLKENFENLINIKNIRGIRRSNGLPINGQRTHTNSKTSKKFKNKFI